MTTPPREGTFKRLVRSLSRSGGPKSPGNERPPAAVRRASSRSKRQDDIRRYAPKGDENVPPLPSPSNGIAYSTSPPPGASPSRSPHLPSGFSDRGWAGQGACGGPAGRGCEHERAAVGPQHGAARSPSRAQCDEPSLPHSLAARGPSHDRLAQHGTAS